MNIEGNLLDQFYSLNRRIAAGGVYWTQGQGSNISVKEGSKLWIKASGFRLDEVEPGRGAVCIELDSLKSEVHQLLRSSLGDDEKEQHYADLLKASASHDTSGHRPSMETGFHALIPSTFVAHFHSLVGILLCGLLKSPETQVRTQECINNSGYKTIPLVIPQVKPGLALADYFLSETKQEFVLIENHGVILHGENSAHMLDQWIRLENLLIERKLIQLPKAPEVNEAPHLQSLEPLFPDFAVFIERIAEHSLEIQRDGRRFWGAQGSLIDQRNFIELWQAQWLLEQAQPRAERFDPALCSMLGKMPTEKFRKRV